MTGLAQATPPAGLLLLLLSASLFNCVRGSFSSQGDNKVSSHGVFEGYDVGPELLRAQQTLKRKHLLSSSARTTTTASLRLPDGGVTHLEVPGKNLALSSNVFPAFSVIDSRNLQESACASGSASLDVSSTVFPLMEGCLVASVDGGAMVYKTATATIETIVSTDSTQPPKWVAHYQTSTGDGILACLSGESTDDVIAGEATWYCDADGDGADFALADEEEFSVSCGCSVEAPSPVAAPAPAPTDGSACVEGDSFSIASGTFPDAEGCFIDTALTVNGFPVYSESGTIDPGQIVVITGDLFFDDGSSMIVWFLANHQSSTSTDANEIYCYSVGEAASYHPSDVPSWQCDTDGDGTQETTADDAMLSVSCGCSVTPLPAPTPTPPFGSGATSSPLASILTPAPMGNGFAPSPVGGSSSGACVVGDSFSVVSATFPDTEGCYLDTAETNNDHTIYTPSGTVDYGQIMMFASERTLDDGSTMIVWVLANLISSTSEDANLVYCFSVTEAYLYHPSDVPSWQCDTDGDGDFETTADGVVSVSCGCSETSLPNETPAPTPGTRGIGSPLSSTRSPIDSPTVPTASPMSAGDDFTITEDDDDDGDDDDDDDGDDDDDDDDDVTESAVASTCSGDGSFTITANAAPALDGCFLDTGASTAALTTLYTISGGTTDTTEVVVSSIILDTGDFKWFIGERDGTTDFRGYCISEESASEVNPGTASWLCDFVGDADNYLSTSNEDISIVCGSCSEAIGAGGGSSPASTVVVRLVTVVGASVLAVVTSAIAGWC